MNRRPATPTSPLATGIIAGEVAALSADAQPPKEMKIAPAGPVVTRDGRPFSFNPAQLAARFAAEGVDIAIDLDHAISRRVMFGETAPAVGWIKALSARPDGLYATEIDWLDEGRAALAARTHRYISPTFHHTEAGEATWLHSVALVAAPALSMPAVADATGQPETSMLKAIAKALGLAETADEAACLSAIASLSAGKVDKGVYDQALANLSAANAKLDEIQKQGRDDKVKALLDQALQEKKIVPAQRPQYEALCSTDAGFASVEELLKSTVPGLPPSDLDKRAPGEGQSGLSAEDKRICAQLGLTEEEWLKANPPAAA